MTLEEVFLKAEPKAEKIAEESQYATPTLRESVELTIGTYLQQVGDEEVKDIYQLVLSEVEAPLLEQVMRHVKYNQTKASVMLGLNRGTLRKKLKMYGLL